MNQAVLFNDDLHFDKKADAWSFSCFISGQSVVIYFHSLELKQLKEISNCTKYDLEEITELWLEKNELEGNTIHITLK